MGKTSRLLRNTVTASAVLTIAALSLATGSSTAVYAQISMPMPDGMMVGDSLSILWNDADLQKPQSAPKRPSSGAKSVRVTFDFAPSIVRRQANVASFIEQNRRFNPAVGAELERVFKNIDVIGALQQGLNEYGLKVTNVADAYTVWWINAWEAANAVGVSQTSLGSVKAVKLQVEQTLGTGFALANATDAQKQQIAEQLLLQAVVFDSLSKVKASDPDKARQISDNVRRTVGQAGLNLDAFTLTQNGFVPAIKKRSDAVDAMQDKAEGLSSAAADNEGWSDSELALVAAAGGAGLTGVFLFGRKTRKND